MSAVVSGILAWEALDSRGRPTVACRLELDDGAAATVTVPSGASAGSHESLELRDGGDRFGGRGVLRAVANVNAPIRKRIVGAIPSVVDALLAELDGTADFTKLGANATLAVSLASAIAEARSEGVHLARHLNGDGPLLIPMPMVNIFSGGAHAGGILDVQDFLAIPVGAHTFRQAIEWSCAVREAAAVIVQNRGYPGAYLVADEGGIGVGMKSHRAALELLTEAIESAGLEPGKQVGIAIDVAASEFFDGQNYRLKLEQRTLSSADLIEELESWCDDFPILSIEDGLAEDDWAGWDTLTRRLGSRIDLVGDDLFVTHRERLELGIRDRVANSVLVKVNQNGLLSGAKSVLDLAKASGYKTVVSARSGETEDTWLADLATGWRAGQIKVGSTHRSERNAKWNRLLELEATESTRFAGPWPENLPADRK